ncbi:hypothetical protein Rhopal_004021-T1 [Rhodotorula paludigena]|uniref:Transcription elongation factor Spt6 n=1 Tax=Rhodotorula paludigena TaxID=86838 RepID=A0AAV5GND4_9BASI|nr:hypothetical protein Rhopal_004021-T1 [Rhodotorula paludigena]
MSDAHSPAASEALEASADERSPQPDSDDDQGIDLRPGAASPGDSSEEDATDSEEERAVRKDFIVDEDESARRRRHKKKRRKHRRADGDGAGGDGSDAAAGRGDKSRKRRKGSDDEDAALDEDDLELLQENMGIRISKPKNKLKRLRRRRSGSSGGSPRDSGALADIFADEDDDDDDVRGGGAGASSSRGAGRRGDALAGGAGGIEELFDADEMAGFIEDDTDESSRSEAGDSDEDDEARRARRREKKERRRDERTKRRQRGFAFAGRVEGITQEAWLEVAEVFGNGMDYAWAMEDDDDDEKDQKKELKDIFEPSEIASRMLTEADDKIRRLDVPERQQLSSSGLPDFALTEEGFLVPLIPEHEIKAAALWMSDKISRGAVEQYLVRDAAGNLPPLHQQYLDALEHVVRFLNVDFLEPPHIWHHRSDFLFHAPSGHVPHALLVEDDLWRASDLCIKYRAFLARRADLERQLRAAKLEPDAHLEEVLEQAASVEEVMDAQGWVALRLGEQIARAKSDRRAAEGEGAPAEGEEDEGDAAMAGTTKRPKRATRESEYDDARKTVVRRLAELINVSPAEFALDVASRSKTHFAEDPDKTPLELADEYVVEAFPSREQALAAAKTILVTELGHEPILRKEARRYLREVGVVNVAATKLGEQKIDQMNPYYAFKYLKNKPVKEFLRSPQWMQILAAEAEGLVHVSIDLPQSAFDQFFGELAKVYLSDYTSALADEWNALRRDILDDAVRNLLVPHAASWARNMLKEEGEDFIGQACQRKLFMRIDAAPWCRRDKTMEPGDTPSVLALSNGRGDPKRDSVVGVFLDSDGYFREQFKLDNVGPEMDEQQREQLAEFLKRRRPQVVVVGGFSPAAVELLDNFRRFAHEISQQMLREDLIEDEEGEENLDADELYRRKENRAAFESTFVHDDVARIYQNSPRAAQEFSEMSQIAKYCVGLARYAQSPLNEYAALGSDLTALTYDPNQKYLAKDKVVRSLERALIDITNRVGVDLNKAARNPYYAHLMQYVSGLGPRKAAAVLSKIGSGGTVTTRQSLVTRQIMSQHIFVNTAGFLRIRQDDLAADLGRDTENEEDPDVLDDTRIHPEDYDVARKMAADAMEYDEEDLEAGTSKAVADLLDDDVRKLNDLALDDFAEELSKVLNRPKRLTLYKIREELQHPFAEKRQPFLPPSQEERFTMLTGETRTTLSGGLIIPVRVLRVSAEETVLVRLDCGITGSIAAEYRTDGQVQTKLRPGQTLQAMVIAVNYDQLNVELSTQEHLIDIGDRERRVVRPDTWFDQDRAQAEQRSAVAAQEKQGGGRVKRVIKHPNFHDVSAGEAEQMLASMQRGDCIIRPSSREDHIAVTWKVDEGIYQHLAVHELNKPNAYSLGTQLRVSDKHRYSDLDELIDAHVKQMARRVNEMTNSERFKGTKEQLDKFLQNYTLANPGRSIYAFGWAEDRKKAGQLVLGFRTNEKSPMQYWPVIVVPEGFMLRGEVHGDVQSLINGFKRAYQHTMQGGARQPPAAGGQTGRYLGGATPNPYGGGRTPAYGQQPGYGGGRTPNPHQQQYPPPPGMGGAPYAGMPGLTYGQPGHGGATPGYGGGAPPMQGYAGGGYGQR